MLSSSPQTATHTRSANLQPTSVAVPRRLLIWLTVGVGGTLLFVLTYLIEGVTRPGFSAWRDTISSLSFGPYGWVQQANFMLCGASCIVLAVVWRQMLKGGVCATWYPIMRGVEGCGLIALGIFRVDPLHTASMVITMIGMFVGLLIIARRFWGQPQWRGWATFTLICALWPNIVLPLFGLALNPLSPLSGYAGLIERLATSPDIAWGVLLLLPLWAGRSLMLPRFQK